jgi:hypothetical protein
LQELLFYRLIPHLSCPGIGTGRWRAVGRYCCVDRIFQALPQNKTGDSIFTPIPRSMHHPLSPYPSFFSSENNFSFGNSS